MDFNLLDKTSCKDDSNDKSDCSGIATSRLIGNYVIAFLIVINDANYSITI